MSVLDKKLIRSDPWMKRLMMIGVPVAIIGVIALWLGQTLHSPALGSLFIISTAVALITGLIYNVRFVMLSVRQLKEKNKQTDDNSTNGSKG